MKSLRVAVSLTSLAVLWMFATISARAACTCGSGKSGGGCGASAESSVASAESGQAAARLASIDQKYQPRLAELRQQFEGQREDLDKAVNDPKMSKRRLRKIIHRMAETNEELQYE